MEKTKHTPEPWVAKRQRVFGKARHNPVDVKIATTHFRDRGVQIGAWEAEANAKRIVSCVNACEGINPEAVPDLLAALGAIAEFWNDPDDCIGTALSPFALLTDSDTTTARDMVNAAIAKAKGE